MKTKEVLELLKITRPTLTKYVKEGVIKTGILPSGRYDYQSESVYILLEQKKKGKGDKIYQWYTLPEYPYLFSPEEKQIKEARVFWNQMRSLINWGDSCCLSVMQIDKKPQWFLGAPAFVRSDMLGIPDICKTDILYHNSGSRRNYFYQNNINEFGLETIYDEESMHLKYAYMNQLALSVPKNTQVILEFERVGASDVLSTNLYVTLKIITDKTQNEIENYLHCSLKAVNNISSRKAVPAEVYERFTPFGTINITNTNQYSLSYGLQQETKEPIKIDRRQFDTYKTMMVCGVSGTGKQRGTDKEIQQVLNMYKQDRVIISNAEFDHSKEDMKEFHPEYLWEIDSDETCKKTKGIFLDFLDKDYHINVLDVVYDTEKGADLLKKCKQAVAFIEVFYAEREDISLKDNDVQIIYHCVLSLLLPFVEELKKQCDEKKYVYDPVHNPKHADLMNALLKSNCSSELKEKICYFRDLSEHPEIQKDERKLRYWNFLHYVLWDTKGTNIPDEKCLELGIHNTWIDSHYVNLAPVLIVSHVDTLADIGKSQYQTIWVYWDYAHILFRNKKLTEVIFDTTDLHSNIKVTFEFSGINDICLDEQHLALFKNPNVLWKFYSLCPLDRKLLPKVINIPEWVINKYLWDQPAGRGLFVKKDICFPFTERDK